jgi:predicted small lipoprotein YifL
MKTFKTISIILVVFLLVGCGYKQVVLTPDQEANRLYYEQKNQHNSAVKKFTQMLIKYNLWCERPEYTDACAAVDPFVVKANKALDTWEKLIDSREPIAGSDEDYQTALKNLKTEMLMNLPGFSF